MPNSQWARGIAFLAYRVLFHARTNTNMIIHAQFLLEECTGGAFKRFDRTLLSTLSDVVTVIKSIQNIDSGVAYV